jgi:hypothetical protein
VLGELVGIDCVYVGQLRGTSRGLAADRDRHLLIVEGAPLEGGQQAAVKHCALHGHGAGRVSSRRLA